MRISTSISLGLTVLCLGGCALEAPPPEEPRVEVGTGSWRFEPLVDEDSVELIRGSQGGWHFWLSVRTQGVEAEDVILTIETQLEDESRPAEEVDVDVRLGRMNDEGERTLLGWPAIVADPACLAGHTVRVSITLQLADGSTLSDERYVRIAGGSDPPPACE